MSLWSQMSLWSSTWWLVRRKAYWHRKHRLIMANSRDNIISWNTDSKSSLSLGTHIRLLLLEASRGVLITLPSKVGMKTEIQHLLSTCCIPAFQLECTCIISGTSVCSLGKINCSQATAPGLNPDLLNIQGLWASCLPSFVQVSLSREQEWWWNPIPRALGLG